MIKKIVVIGPESTGKSNLCQQLAEHFKTAWVREYARAYLIKNGPAYQYEDLYNIAVGQMLAEQNAYESLNLIPQAPNLLFIDTDLHVIKVWSEYVYNKCDNRLLRAIASSDYDLYLLCNTDIDWVEDALREYPDPRTRRKLFYYYKESMTAQDVPWVEIKGNYQERFQQAVRVLNEHSRANKTVEL